MTDCEEYIEFCSDIRELKGQHDLIDTVIPSKPSLSEKPVQQELWPSVKEWGQTIPQGHSQKIASPSLFCSHTLIFRWWLLMTRSKQKQSKISWFLNYIKVSLLRQITVLQGKEWIWRSKWCLSSPEPFCVPQSYNLNFKRYSLFPHCFMNQ